MKRCDENRERKIKVCDVVRGGGGSDGGAGGGGDGGGGGGGGVCVCVCVYVCMWGDNFIREVTETG